MPTSKVDLAYEPYGYCRVSEKTSSFLGFNGAHADVLTGNYALGNGHRVYAPTLRRFQSADRLSPFGRGGLNTYVYCLGDPINRADPSGQFSLRRRFQAWTGGPKSVASLRELKNTNADRIYVETERTRYNLHYGFAKLMVVEQEGSLPALLGTSRSYTHKWLVTKSGEFVIGSFDHTKAYSTHASFAVLAAEMKGVDPIVVAAGELEIKKGRIVMNNYSGHYKTSYGRLWPVKMHVERFAGEMKIVRQSYLAVDPATHPTMDGGVGLGRW